MIRAWLQRRCELRERIRKEATDLITFLGDHAYGEARGRARAARKVGSRRLYGYYSKVAVEIAARTGRDVGVTGADRYPVPRPRPRSYSARDRRQACRNIARDDRALSRQG